MKSLKNEVKSLKKNKNIFPPKNIIKPPLLPVFIPPVIQFDKFFHAVVLYENYFICIFMNINENLKMRENINIHFIGIHKYAN